MGELETGYKWWIRYVIVPLTAGGGIVAILLTNYLGLSRQKTDGIAYPVSSKIGQPLSDRGRVESSKKPMSGKNKSELEQPTGKPEPEVVPQTDAQSELYVFPPDPNRHKEQLEAFPLDSLEYIGSLGASNIVGLVTAPNKVTYRVQVGNYMGQQNGQIIAISSSEITLLERIHAEGAHWKGHEVKIRLDDN